MLNVFIVEDHQPIQNRLINMIDETDGLHVVGCCSTIQTGLQAIPAQHPDAVILDIHLEDGNSLGLLSALKREDQYLKVLVLTNDSSSINFEKFNRAGADVCLDKSTDFTQIIPYLQSWARSQENVSLELSQTNDGYSLHATSIHSI